MTLKEEMQQNYEETFKMDEETKEVLKRIKETFLKEQKKRKDDFCFSFDMKYDESDCLLLDNLKGEVITLTEGVLTDDQERSLFRNLVEEGIKVTPISREKKKGWRKTSYEDVWYLLVDLS